MNRAVLSNLYRQGIVHASRRCTSLPVSLVNDNDRFYLVVCNEKMSSATWILDTMSLMFGTGGQCSITKLQCSISLSKVEDGESDRDRKSDISVHKRIAGDHKSRPTGLSEFTRLVLASTKHTTSSANSSFTLINKCLVYLQTFL